MEGLLRSWSGTYWLAAGWSRAVDDLAGGGLDAVGRGELPEVLRGRCQYRYFVGCCDEVVAYRTLALAVPVALSLAPSTALSISTATPAAVGLREGEGDGRQEGECDD